MVSLDAPPALQRKLVFVSGKGGVGKTVVSQALAEMLAGQSKRVLWVEFENPMHPAGELVALSERLHHLNCDAFKAFDEYVGTKIGSAFLSRIFTHSRIIQYLAQAAPGIHEIVLLGKVWNLTENYDHTIVDMPSTGYGLAMFQSISNLARLFKGSPIEADAISMLSTFGDPLATGHVVVTLPEETPIQESLELDSFLQKLFPENPVAWIVNRRFPSSTPPKDFDPDPANWKTPLASSPEDFLYKKHALEESNLQVLREKKIQFLSVPYLEQIPGESRSLVHGISHALAQLTGGAP